MNQLSSIDRVNVRVGERYYTVEELTATWKVSPHMIVGALEGHPGVMNVGKVNPADSEFSLRIPQSVVDLVYEQSDPAILDKY